VQPHRNLLHSVVIHSAVQALPALELQEAPLLELRLNQHSQARHSEARLEPREDLASVNQPQEQVLLEVQRHQQLDLVLDRPLLPLLSAQQHNNQPHLQYLEDLHRVHSAHLLQQQEACLALQHNLIRLAPRHPQRHLELRLLPPQVRVDLDSQVLPVMVLLEPPPLLLALLPPNLPLDRPPPLARLQLVSQAAKQALQLLNMRRQLLTRITKWLSS
jgi:hypothetical protein